MYFLDGASVIAALALRPQPGDTVLDMCAAPGGKSLILASCLFGELPPDEVDNPPGLLVCNEVSKPRAKRLYDVMSSFLPETVFGSKSGIRKIEFTSCDAQTTHSTMERLAPFDKILVDAPCSSDRHLLKGSSEMLRWSSGTPKVNAQRQTKLLHNAIWLLKDGGILMYATCALADQENDGVIETFLRKAKKSFRLEVLPVTEELLSWVPGFRAEQTDWGVRFLPDDCAYGPMYFARIRKLG
jgi:16S rRNA C967 or C1407 C5-methylase (RsmB/RsmF family)